MSLTVKVYYNDEIRRINIDGSAVASFPYLKEKIRSTISSLPTNDVSFKWMDSDGDKITFSTDEELVDALGSADNGVFKVYIERTSPVLSQSMPNVPFAWIPNSFNGGVDNTAMFVHQGVTCDNCDVGPIIGDRFKCKTCPDFDLCKECKSKKVHEHHEFENFCPKPREDFSACRCHGKGSTRFCGGRKGRFGGNAKRVASKEGNSSSGEEGGHDPPTRISPEMRKKLRPIVNKIVEAAKARALEIAGPVAGDCAGQSVAIAVRSSVKRALIVQKTTNEISHDAPERSDSSDSDFDDPIGDKTVPKDIRKLTKKASKKLGKLSKEKVSGVFGKIAGQWAQRAVRDSLYVSIIQSYRANRVPETPVPEECVPSAPSATLNNEEQHINSDAPENPAILVAINAMKEMGIEPNKLILDQIRDCKGNLQAVFDHWPSGGT